MLRSDWDSHLYEDMPSAVHLRRLLGSRITVILLFTDDEQELLKIESARLSVSQRPSILEWRRRLGLKYSEAASRSQVPSSEAARQKYVDDKLRERRWT